MGRYLGNHGALKLDISAEATGATITDIPFVKEITPKTDRPKIPVVAMGDDHIPKLADFPDFELTVAAWDDQSTDALRIYADGKDRLFLYCYDTTATTKKGGYGVGNGGWSPSIKYQAGVDGALVISSSTGTVNEFFASSIPDPT